MERRKVKKENNKRRSPLSPQARSEAWELVIRAAGNLAATSNQIESLEAAIRMLEGLQMYLEKRHGHFHRAPKHLPPSGSSVTESQFSVDYEAEDVIFVTQQQQHHNHNNPFAALEGDDEDTDEEDDLLTVEEDGGVQAGVETNHAHQAVSMTMRRLLIRVLTSLTELHIKCTQIRRHGDENQSTMIMINLSRNTQEYAVSFDCLGKALCMADEEYARLCLQEQHAQGVDANTEIRMDQLAQDAQVVLIATTHFTEERDRYYNKCKRRMQYLFRKLAPQWESRDQVKSLLGKDRWENNPRPKNDYAAQRRAMEAELKAVQDTLDRLSAMDTSQAVGRTQCIYETASMQTTNGRFTTQRYNGIRPDYSNSRVSFDMYPDATLYEWTFTGSVQESRVEFFEKEFDGILVKLDFYYTTATIKTTLNHPKQGSNQLLGKTVSPEKYLENLLNPRSYINARHRKEEPPNLHGTVGKNQKNIGGTSRYKTSRD